MKTCYFKKSLFFILLVSLVIISILLCSCGGEKKPTILEPKWSYASAAIKIRYKATKDLNFYNGEAHSVILKIFQLKDSSHFKDLVQSKGGLIRALQFSGQTQFLGDAQSDVVSYKQFIVMPGEEKVISLDRLEGTKWIAILAGYYNLDPIKSVKIFQIPVIYKEEGLIFKTKTVSLGELFVNLILGPLGIQQIGG